MKKLILLVLPFYFGCRTADGGIDMTLKVKSYNSNGSYNQVDFGVILFTLFCMFVAYGAGREKGSFYKYCLLILLFIVIVFPVMVLVIQR